MTDIQAWLDQGKTLADKATEGPWDADGREITQHWSRPEPWQTIVGTEVACMAYCYGGSAEGVERDEDATFIADARTRLPQALNALQAVLDLHKPMQWWELDREYTLVCEHCWGPYDSPVYWPCRTVLAITGAIKGTDA